MAATLTVVVVLLVVGSVLLRDNGADPVAVPNVVGKKLADATALLRTRGFKLDDVSYRPVSEGEAGRVVETIPAAKEMVDPGSDIHVIASAYAATPTPVVTSAPSDERPRRGKHKHHKD
jgi:serine/threonine-protein kinase